MSEPRRIALLGPAYPFRGGIAHFLSHLEVGLRDRGHTTRMFTFTRQYPERLFPGKTQLETGPPPAVLPERVLDPINPLSWRRTVAAIRRFEPDSLVLKYWMPYFAPSFGYVARSLRGADVPSTFIVDNAIPHERRPGDIALGRYVLRAAANLVAMSDTVRNDIEGRIGVRVPVQQVLHPIYDNFGSPVPKSEARRALGLDDEAKLILFFGFIRPYKGLHVLLDAMPTVAARLPGRGGAQLLIAGECYGDDEAYRAAIARIPPGVVRWDDDYIPDEKVAHYFSAADVVVQPYISATQSGVAQIAYHFEKPMIVTSVGGLPEVVAHGEAGLVVPPLDAGALADAIVTYFEQGLADRFAARVRQEKVRFTWEPLYEAVESGGWRVERGTSKVEGGGWKVEG